MGERKKSGIYVILNLSNGKRYIGQAASIGDRWLTHRSHLDIGRHHSKYLQASWKKYGADNFKFSVLEYVPLDKSLLAEREQFWMDHFSPEYNVAPAAGSSLGLKHPPRSDEFRQRMADMKRGHIKSPETIERQREAARRINYKHPPEIRALISAALTGRTRSAETIEKHRQKMLGRKQSPGQIAKRVAKLIGHKTSDYTKQRIGEANRARLLGTKQSPELIEKRAAALRGKKRPAHVVAALHEALRLTREPQINAIKRALAADPNLNQTHLAAQLGCGRATIRKYQRELLCQPLQQSDSASDASDLQNPLDT